MNIQLRTLIGQIDITEQSADLNNLRGRHKDSVIFINGWTKRVREKNQYQITITSDNILLDKDVYSALDAGEKKIWDDFTPTGVVAINYTFARESPTNKTGTLKVTAKNCQAIWNKIRYPLKNVTGSLSFRQGQTVLSNVVSTNGTEKITIDGKIIYDEPNRADFDINLKAEDIEPNSVLQNIAWDDFSAACPDKQTCDYRQYSVGRPHKLPGAF